MAYPTYIYTQDMSDCSSVITCTLTEPSDMKLTQEQWPSGRQYVAKDQVAQERIHLYGLIRLT